MSINPKSFNLSKKKLSVLLPGENIEAIKDMAYDNFIKGKGSKSSFTCTKFSGWTADTYWQDLGGSGGLVLRCVSKSEVSSQVSYIDCYEASSGTYTGSYKFNVT